MTGQLSSSPEAERLLGSWWDAELAEMWGNVELADTRHVHSRRLHKARILLAGLPLASGEKSADLERP